MNSKQRIDSYRAIRNPPSQRPGTQTGHKEPESKLGRPKNVETVGKNSEEIM